MKSRHNAQGSLYALTAFAVFSAHDLVVKLLGAEFAPFQIVFFSVLFGFPVVAIMLLRDRTAGNLIPRRPFWILGRTAAQVTATVCAFYAFSSLPLAQAYAILFAAPLLITLLAIPVLGEKVGWRRGLAVIVGLVGVMVVLQPGSTRFELAHGAALLAACCGAFAAVVVRKIGREERHAVLMLYPMVANFLVMGAALAIVYEPMEIQHIGGFFTMSLLAFCATLFQIAAYRLADAAVVAPMQYSQILWATLFGVVFFEEHPTWNTIAGASIVIASGLFVVLRETRKADTGAPVLSTQSHDAQGSSLYRAKSIERLLR